MSKKILFILVLLLFNLGYGQTNTWTGTTSTAWETNSNWSLGIAPIAIHDVVIPAVINQPIISTSGITCATLTLGAGSNLMINSTGILGVTGEINISEPTVDNENTILSVGAGILTANGITMGSGANDTRRCTLKIDTGTASIAGSILMAGTVLQNDITFTGVGTLNIGGTITGGSLVPGIGLIDYNGLAAQTVGTYVYHNLTLSGAGIKTFIDAIAVNNTLSIDTGVVADLGGFTNTTFFLSLNGANSSTGTWGGTGSGAININPVFFAANSGVVNVGMPTVQASNIAFSNITSTSATVSWTNGNGAFRVVFVRAGSGGGSAAPLNYFNYTPSSTFGLGSQIGTTGWYCVYKGEGTIINIAGLSPLTTYQVMTLEYNGSLGNELHLTTTITGNPAEVTTNNLTAVNPGGIEGEVAWYKGNTGVTLNGSNVSQWSDYSGNANNATQGTAVSQPAYNANSFNFNQALTFSGSNYLATPVNNLPSGNSARSVFVVATSTNTQTGNSWTYGYGTSSPGRGFNVGKLVNATPVYVSIYGSGTQSPTDFWTTNVPKLATITYNTPTVSYFDAGSLLGTASQAGYNTLLAANGGRIGSFVNSGNENWRGTIAEIIVYPSLITGNAAISVESYLAIKYGIHKTGNYLDGAGNVVWDATANATYHNDVFGIAQDDASQLLQTQSNSTNTGSGDGTGQSGKGNIIISNPSSLANNGFLLIGHDTNALTETDVTVAGHPTKRIQRIWKVQNTGNPGTVTLSYDITGLTYSGQIANDYVLLVDPTGTGDFSGGSVVKYPAATLTANKVSFNTVNLPTGAVFTFQTLSKVPPIITNFSPQSGPVGTTVTITGANFSATAAQNIVFFGATMATVTAATTTSLTVTVPVGATYEPISVLNGATTLLGYSTSPFITTFTPNKGNITIDDIMSKVDFPVTNNAFGITIGDFDGDGKSDLAVANNAASSVSVFLNTATSGSITTSSFAPKVDFPVGARLSEAMG